MKEKTEHWIAVGKSLPLKNHRVIVVCKHARCLGYLDDHGIWRDDAESTALKDVIGWVEFSRLLNDTKHIHRLNAGQ